MKFKFIIIKVISNEENLSVIVSIYICVLRNGGKPCRCVAKYCKKDAYNNYYFKHK